VTSPARVVVPFKRGAHAAPTSPPLKWTAVLLKIPHPTVAKELQIGLYDPAQADSKLICNSWSTEVLRERLYYSPSRVLQGAPD